VGRVEQVAGALEQQCKDGIRGVQGQALGHLLDGVDTQQGSPLKRAPCTCLVMHLSIN
jgi:hypothetical protein